MKIYKKKKEKENCSFSHVLYFKCIQSGRIRKRDGSRQWSGNLRWRKYDLRVDCPFSLKQSNDTDVRRAGRKHETSHKTAYALDLIFVDFLTTLRFTPTFLFVTRYTANFMITLPVISVASLLTDKATRFSRRKANVFTSYIA